MMVRELSPNVEEQYCQDGVRIRGAAVECQYRASRRSAAESERRNQDADADDRRQADPVARRVEAVGELPVGEQIDEVDAQRRESEQRAGLDREYESRRTVTAIVVAATAAATVASVTAFSKSI